MKKRALIIAVSAAAAVTVVIIISILIQVLPHRAKDLNVTFSFRRKDLGTVPWGKFGNAALEIANCEKFPVDIQVMKCRCIEFIGVPGGFSIAPGRKTNLVMRFNPSGYSGWDVKAMTFILTSPSLAAPDQEEIFLKLYAVIDPEVIGRPFQSAGLPVSFSFKGHDFGRVPAGSHAYAKLFITNRSAFDLLVGLKEQYSCAVPSKNYFTIPAGSNASVVLTFSPPRGEGPVRAGIFNTKLEVFLYTNRNTNLPPVSEEILLTAVPAFAERSQDRKEGGKLRIIRDSSRKWATLLSEKGCKNCMELRAVLDEIISNGKLTVYLREIADPENLPLIIYLKQEKGVTVDGYPVLIAGGTVLSGPALKDRSLVEKTVRGLDGGAISNANIFDDFIESDAQGYVDQGVSKVTIPGVILIGLLDGINPCAFATIVFLISYLGYIGRKRREIVIIGSFYSLSVFVTYFLLGLGMFGVLFKANEYRIVSIIIKYAAAAVVFVFAVLSAADFVKALKGKTSEMSLALPDTLVKRIHKVIRENARMGGLILSSVIIGLMVSFFELACTGQMYFPTIQAMVQTDRHVAAGLFYLVLYCVAFIVPLLIIFALNILGISSQKLQDFLRKNLALLKILMAAGFTLLGVYMVLG